MAKRASLDSLFASVDIDEEAAKRIELMMKLMPNEIAKHLKPAFRKWIALYRRLFKRQLKAQRLKGTRKRDRWGNSKVTGKYNKGWVTSRIRGTTLRNLRAQMEVRYPYAKLHEEGGTINRRGATVKAHYRRNFKRNLQSPKEEFIVRGYRRRGGSANYKATLGAYSLANRLQPRLRKNLLEAAESYISGATGT